MEQLDVLEGGYLPQAWGTAEEEQTTLRRALLELLNGARRLGVDIPGSSLAAKSNQPSSAHPSGHSAQDGLTAALYLLHYTGQIGTAGFGMVKFSEAIWLEVITKVPITWMVSGFEELQISAFGLEWR